MLRLYMILNYLFSLANKTYEVTQKKSEKFWNLT